MNVYVKNNEMATYIEACNYDYNLLNLIQFMSDIFHFL